MLLLCSSLSTQQLHPTPHPTQAKKAKAAAKRAAEKKVQALDAAYKKKQAGLRKDAQRVRKEAKVGGFGG